MTQSLAVGSVLGGRYRITEHLVTSADQNLVFLGADQVLNRRVTILVASRENAAQVATSARELATGERQEDVQVLDLGLSDGRTYLITGGRPDPDVLLGLAYPQELHVEPFQTDTLGSEIFGATRVGEAHRYADDEDYYSDLDRQLRADEEQSRRRPGFLNRISERITERVRPADGTAAKAAAGAAALAAAEAAQRQAEEDHLRAEQARVEAEREAAEAAEIAEREALQERHRREREAAAAAEEAERRAEEEHLRAEQEVAEATRRAEEEARAEEARAQQARAEQAEADQAAAERAAQAEAEQAEIDRAIAAHREIEAEAERSERAEAERRESEDRLAAAEADLREEQARTEREAAEAEAREAEDDRLRADDEAQREAAAEREADTVAAAVVAPAAVEEDHPNGPSEVTGADASEDAPTGSTQEARDDQAAPADSWRTEVAAASAALAAGTAGTAVPPRTPRPAPRRALPPIEPLSVAPPAAIRDSTAPAPVTGLRAAGGATDAGTDRVDDRKADRVDGQDRDSTAPPTFAVPAAGSHPEGSARRGGLMRWLLPLLILLGLLAAVAVGFLLLNQNMRAVPAAPTSESGAPASSRPASPRAATTSASPTPTSSPSDGETSTQPTASPSDPAASPTVAVAARPTAAAALRAVPDLPELEDAHDDALAAIVDGDPSTAWQSYAYTRPNFGGYVESMDLIVQLEERAQVHQITLEQAGGTGGTFTALLADSPEGENAREVGQGTFDATESVIPVDLEDPAAEFVIIRLTSLPRLESATGDRPFGLRLTEIGVR